MIPLFLRAHCTGAADPVAKIQFARILDLCVNPEMKGMTGTEEEDSKKDEMAYAIMLAYDT